MSGWPAPGTRLLASWPQQQISPISGGPFLSERPWVQFWIAIEAIAQRATPIRFVVLEVDDHPIDRCFM
jgi:hypothetical protein